MKNPFRSPSIAEKVDILLNHHAHRLFEARLAAIEHNHYIQRIEAEIAYLKKGKRELHEESGGNDE